MSWSIGFSIIAVSVGISIAIFLIGIPKYRKQVPVGSPLTRIAQVIVAALKKWRLSSTRNHYGIYYDEEDHKSESTNATKIYLLARTNQFKYVLSINIHLYHLNFHNSFVFYKRLIYSKWSNMLVLWAHHMHLNVNILA